MEHLSLRKQLNNAAQTTRDNTADHSVAILSRWVLVVICLLTVGSHVGKHFISSLGPAVMERLSLSRAEFGLLFSLQGIPGAVLPVLGGILIAALHLPYGHVAAILATVVLFGQILTCFAVQLRSFPIVLLGRLLFGIGDGALVVVQGAIVGKWFKRELISTAFGITIFCSRLSSFAGFAAPGILQDRLGLMLAMWFTAALCGMSLVAAVLYMWIERKADKLRDHSAQRLLDPVFDVYSIRSVRVEVSDTLQALNIDFWYIALIWSVLASTVFALLHFAADIALSGFSMTHSSAKIGLFTGLLFLFAGMCSPFVGWMQDRTGYRVNLIVFSLFATSGGVVLVLLSLKAGVTQLAVAGLACIALGFGVAPVTLVSCVAIVIETSRLPAALGVYKAAENVFLALMHFVSGALRDASGSYQATLISFAILPMFGILAAWKLDSGSSSQKLRETLCDRQIVDAEASGLNE